MIVVIQTVYVNVDEEWLQWWLENRMPTKEIANEIREKGKSVLVSKDPTSDVIAKTSYEVFRDD